MGTVFLFRHDEKNRKSVLGRDNSTRIARSGLGRRVFCASVWTAVGTEYRCRARYRTDSFIACVLMSGYGSLAV